MYNVQCTWKYEYRHDPYFKGKKRNFKKSGIYFQGGAGKCDFLYFPVNSISAGFSVIFANVPLWYANTYNVKSMARREQSFAFELVKEVYI